MRIKRWRFGFTLFMTAFTIEIVDMGLDYQGL